MVSELIRVEEAAARQEKPVEAVVQKVDVDAGENRRIIAMPLDSGRLFVSAEPTPSRAAR